MTAALEQRTDAPDHVQGMIERITFHNGETGFAVLQVKVRGQKDLVTVLGKLPEVGAGEWVDAHGRWVIDRQYGRQFQARYLATTPPNTAEGMKKYMGSGLIKGIGPALASRLVDCVWRCCVRCDREGAGAVAGGGWDRAGAMREDHGGVGRPESGAADHGVSPWPRRQHQPGVSHLQGVWRGCDREGEGGSVPAWRDIWGIGFKTADQIAASLGIGRQSELRARAGVEFVLQELTNEGHCACPRPVLVQKAQAMLGIAPELIEAAIEHGIGEGRLMEEPDAEGRLLMYLSGFRWAETKLAANLLALCHGKHPCPEIDPAAAVLRVEKEIGFALAPAQQEAIGQALASKVMVITGGPGVGKTTLVNAIVRIFRGQGLGIVLCAPTGRAAKRMSEATGMEAKTIHRLLGFDPGSGGFKRDQSNPLIGDVFIVDEVSMVDLILAHQFVRAVPPNAALILVGDVDQLPSVGPGSVLRDVIESDVLPVSRLTEVFRQAAQ